MVCFHRNQTGHRKAECPQLHQGSAQGYAPTARVTEVRPVKAEAPKARGRAFQLTAEEVRSAPDVVAGMYSVFYILLMILCLYDDMRRYFSCEFCTCFGII